MARLRHLLCRWGSALLRCAEVCSASSEPCRAKARAVMEAVTSGVDCERAALLLVDEVHSQQLIVAAIQMSARLCTSVAKRLSST